MTAARTLLPRPLGRGAPGPEFGSADAVVGGDVRIETRPGLGNVSADREGALRREANAAMQAHAQGDSLAFRKLYPLIADRLFHYLQRRMRDTPRAEDLMQQTLLHMHRARGGYDASRGVFPWMYAIAHNLAADVGRRAGREVPLETDGGTDASEPVCAEGAADELLIGLQLEAQIAVVLHQLPERQRAAFELVRQEGLSYAEAAEALGLTIASITSALHRADRAVMAAFKGAEG